MTIHKIPRKSLCAALAALALARTALAAGPLPRLEELGAVSQVQIPGVPPPEIQNPVPAASGPDRAARITGATTRRHRDPGPVKKLWFVYSDRKELERSRGMLERVLAANPGAELRFYREEDVLPRLREGQSDFAPKQARVLFERILSEGAELVLTSSYELYESFRGLRDLGFARDVAFGFAGRRYVSVDIPRASLDPGALSDPRSLPHRKYLVLTEGGPRPDLPGPGEAGGMTGGRAALEEVLRKGRELDEEVQAEEKEKGKKEAEGGLGVRILVWLSGQADSAEAKRRRHDARYLARYLDEEAVDVLAIQGPLVAGLVGEMKRLGYHLGLPVVWLDPDSPGDDTGLNLVLERRDWVDRAPHLAVSSRPELATALVEAAGLERLPDNFGKEGGVPVADYEETVREVVRRSEAEAPPGSPKTYQLHFLLSAGNGANQKGDSNPFGHFGLGVEDERGDVRIWTVHYMDRRGGSFSGGSEPERQLTLGEYLYRLHELPEILGQPTVLGETPVGPVIDFILRGVDEAMVETMREMAAYLDARHLSGEDYYEFQNDGGFTNCISLVTQLLRSAGFAIADSGTEVPGDKAVELFRGFARRLLENQEEAGGFDLVVWDRPTHSASEHYRIPNVVLGSPFLNFKKPWSEMGWLERIGKVFHRPFEFLGVPDFVSAVAELAVRRVTAGPNSRELKVEERAESPIALIRETDRNILALRRERVPIIEEKRALRAQILSALGIEGFRVNPGQDLTGLARRLGGSLGLDEEEQARLEERLRRHHDLDVKLTLNKFDELLEDRTQLFLKLQIADPLKRHAGRMDRLRRTYEEVVAFRDRIESENRILSQKEIDRLKELNEEVHSELHDLRRVLLDEFGPPVPQDIGMIFEGQVSSKTLRTLESLRGVVGGAEEVGKEKGGKGRGKKGS